MNSSAISLEEHTHTMECDLYSSATTHLTHSMNSSAISLEEHTHTMVRDFYSSCSNQIDRISLHLLSLHKPLRPLSGKEGRKLQVSLFKIIHHLQKINSESNKCNHLTLPLDGMNNLYPKSV